MQKIESEDFVLEFKANGEVVVQSKRTCAKATFCAIPAGIAVVGGGENRSGEVLIAFGEDNSLLILDRLKFYW